MGFSLGAARAAAVVSAFVCIGGVARAQGELIENPIWLEEPSAADYSNLYPSAAARAGVRGVATLDCIVNPEGGLGCLIESVTPEGYGFEEASLAMAQRYRMARRGPDGSGNAGRRVVLPIRWGYAAGAPAPESATAPALAVPAGSQAWIERPSDADMQRFYPSRALNAGRAGSSAIECEVQANGRLRNCSYTDENPSGWGFGAAGLRAAGLFRMGPRLPHGGASAGARVRVALSWRPPLSSMRAAPPPAPAETPDAGVWEPPPPEPAGGQTVITNPRWERQPNGADYARFYPRRAERENIGGFVVLACIVNTDRSVSCRVQSETPAGWGFGEASLRASRLFRMTPMTEDGRPTAGGMVTIRMRWSLPD